MKTQFYHWITERHYYLGSFKAELLGISSTKPEWLIDSLSCINGKENYFCIVNWDVLSKSWKWNFDTLCICCVRLQWLPKVKGHFSFTFQWRCVTVHIGVVPFLTRLCLGDLMGVVALLPVSHGQLCPRRWWILQWDLSHTERSLKMGSHLFALKWAATVCCFTCLFRRTMTEFRNI